MNIFKKKFNFFNSSKDDNFSAPSSSTDLVPFESIGPGLAPKPTLTPSVAVPLVTIANVARVAKVATAIPDPVKTVALMSAKSGLAGGAVDAALAGFNALQPLGRKEIDLKQLGIHVASEGVCGFLTAGAGTAGSLCAFMVTGSLGPIVIASGMASSMAVRYGYRCVVGETLPSPTPSDTSNAPPSNHNDFEDIGPNE